MIDAPSIKWVWKTLESILSDRRIDVLVIGEETVSAHEGLRAVALVKRLHLGCLVVAGGYYYPNALDVTFADGNVDVVVRGEDEMTFLDLLRYSDDRSAWPQIMGIAVVDDDGRVCSTSPRHPVEDFDPLPFPAYDLMDMPSYGRGSRNHPGLVSVEHSRGCFDTCSFYILWTHMGKSRDRGYEMRPHVRSQSGERSFENVRRLYHEFDRRIFG